MLEASGLWISIQLLCDITLDFEAVDQLFKPARLL